RRLKQSPPFARALARTVDRRCRVQHALCFTKDARLVSITTGLVGKMTSRPKNPPMCIARAGPDPAHHTRRRSDNTTHASSCVEDRRLLRGDMGSGVLFWGAAAFALVASGAAHSADLHPAMKVALWSWTGGYIGVHGGGGHGRTSFSDPYGPSIHGDIVNTPVFLAGGQIGYNWQTNGRVFGAELDACHGVSDGTNSCLAFSGNVVIATCKPGPNVFVSGTARVGYAFGPQGRSYVKAGVA